MKTNAAPEKARITERIANFIQKHRPPFIVLGVGMVFAIAAVLVVTEVQKARVGAAAVATEALGEDFTNWRREQAAEAKGELEKRLLAKTAELKTRYAGTFAHQRALDLEAAVAYERKDWDAAAAAWVALADGFKSSYLAPIALMNAGAAMEEKGDAAKAAELYRRVVGEYPAYADVPRAIFALGRIAEASDPAAAIQEYEKLLDNQPGSSWTKLAQNRIIYLKTRGKTN